MSNIPTSSEINNLFANSDPDVTWVKAVDIVRRINPAYDFYLAKTTFDDVVRLSRGEYPGYCPLMTLYHNLSHTLDVFLCAVRLMHGVHISGTQLADNEMTMIMMAALLHDVGYAQRLGDETGTGAQYTQCHVDRGVEFMQHYIADQRFPPELATPLKFIILCTDPARVISEINFPDERTRLLGKIVCSADLTGQMADRTYLEKLLFLYLEFKEARFGNFQNIYNLLSNTLGFYKKTRQKLDKDLDGIYTRLTFHFMDRFGVERNYYIESMDKNIAYLSRVISLGEMEYLSMLKRGGIVEKAEPMIAIERSESRPDSPIDPC